MAIVCTGSIAYDYLMSFPGYFKDHILPDKLDSISLSFLVDSMVKQRGGTAPNIAYNLALLGEHPILMGTVGEDFEDYRAALEKAGVDTTYVKVIQGKYTASFFANTDLSNAQIASFYTGAMADAKDLSINDFPRKNVELVVVSPNDPTAMSKYPHECRDLGTPYLYDPGQQVVRMDPQEIKAGIQGAQSVFVNEYEFELVQKHTGLKANEIIDNVDYVVVTCGECGSDIYVKDVHFHIPIVKPDHIADPTGVGDAFRGGFLRGRKLGFDWQTCGKMGSLAATYCIENHGPQNHTYSINDFVQRYRVYFNEPGALDDLLSQK
jgi:adenosine kinase